MMSLTGKVAIVTGASSGIGASIAKHLGTSGAAVAVDYSSTKEGAERTVAEIISQGGRAIAVPADISIAADVRRLFQETMKVFGPPSVLVNNLGRCDIAPIDTISEEAFHREFSLNVLAPILTIQEALRYFPETGGSIINISSITSENPVPNSALYSASEGALDTLIAALAKELGLKRVRVDAVAPGSTLTGFAMLGAEGGEVMAVVQSAMLGGRPHSALRDAVVTRTTMADGLGAPFSGIPESRLRLVKNLVVEES